MSSNNGFVLYHYEPSLPAAIVFSVLFNITTLAHLYQRVKSGSKYMNPFIVGGLFQVIGYGCRAASHFFENSTTLYAIQSLLVLLAPTLYAASIYMILGRTIQFLHAERLSPVPVRWMTKTFVAGDILSFILQGAGGGVMSAGSANSQDIGTYIIVAGLGVQLLFFGVFVIVAFLFHFRFSSSEDAGSAASTSEKVPWARSWKGLLWVLYLVSGLILIRSTFRMVEFAQGFNGYLISHEIFMYVLDTALMFVLMVVMNVVHPSGVLGTAKEEIVECETLEA
ncbi:protein RTA1 [Aspergillus udagawae]|nr:protein RTA1 [Aspergillus udagawae]GFG26501.1 protein RTA1 [Aspergillus udagawae]